MHLNEGEIRAYQDQELEPADKQRVQRHLEACRRCQAKADQLLVDSQQVQEKMALLDTGMPQVRVSAAAARARLDVRRSVITKENETMSSKWYNRVPRPVWAAVLLVVILAIALTFAPVRAVANSFLGLFRVQQIQVVQINPGNLPQQLGSSSQFESFLSQDIQYQHKGEAQNVANAAEASSLAGIPVRLPQEIQEPLTLDIQPGGSANLTVNVQHVRALLAEIGRSDVQIPDMLDGAQISLHVPDGVLAQYGKCEFDAEKAREQGYNPDDQSIPRLPKCTTLVQMPSPTISAPPGLDLQKLGEAYLQVMGMSREEAENFARTIDWASTFVIPIPRYGASYQQVPVDGVTGTLILQEVENQYMLMWVKDGIVYALTGPGDANTALGIVGTME
jgi:hypothetical protein